VSYAVKEIFLTLQGEGAHAGRAAVFCRFSGCNLWSGREQDRAGATCTFCDTDFVGTDGTLGGRYATADELAETIAGLLGDGEEREKASVAARRFAATRAWTSVTAPLAAWLREAHVDAGRLPFPAAASASSFWRRLARKRLR